VVREKKYRANDGGRRGKNAKSEATVKKASESNSMVPKKGWPIGSDHKQRRRRKGCRSGGGNKGVTTKKDSGEPQGVERREGLDWNT